MSKKEKLPEDQSQDGSTDEPTEDAPAAESEGELGLLLEDARAKADEHYNQVLRTQAELENLRKRSARDLENAHKYALEKFMLELLPVRDSLELGIAAVSDTDNVDPAKLKEGVELTLKMLGDAMNKFGLSSVDPQGEKFNPELHQAMSMQQMTDVAPNTVVNVVQKGYKLNERLVRPALVIVSTGGPAADDPNAAKATREYGDPGTDAGGEFDQQA